LRNHVCWLGHVPDEAFAALYSAARALLLPTLHDEVGSAAVEMMACGGAVLASSAGALPDVTEGRGFLIDPHDEAGWRDAMLRVCRDRDWRFSLRARSAGVAEAYTWRRCAERTREAYRRALSAD
jgi:alpha-1,3-rhamnosyl/mannosyltransferase